MRNCLSAARFPRATIPLVFYSPASQLITLKKITSLLEKIFFSSSQTITKIVRNVTGKSLEGKVLEYSDSWTNGVIPLKNTHMGITAPFSLKHWVGYLSAGFWLK